MAASDIKEVIRYTPEEAKLRAETTIMLWEHDRNVEGKKRKDAYQVDNGAMVVELCRAKRQLHKEVHKKLLDLRERKVPEQQYQNLEWQFKSDLQGLLDEYTVRNMELLAKHGLPINLDEAALCEPDFTVPAGSAHTMYT